MTVSTMINPGDLVRVRRSRLVRVLSVAPSGAEVLLDGGQVVPVEDCGVCRSGRADDARWAEKELQHLGFVWPVDAEQAKQVPAAQQEQVQSDQQEQPVQEAPPDPVLQIRPLAPPVKRPRGRPRKN